MIKNDQKQPTILKNTKKMIQNNSRRPKMTKNDAKKQSVTDGPTDGPTDRRSGLQSRVHATKKQVTSENEKAKGHFRRDILEGTFREGLSQFETSKKGQFKEGHYLKGPQKRDIFDLNRFKSLIQGLGLVQTSSDGFPDDFLSIE